MLLASLVAACSHTSNDSQLTLTPCRLEGLRVEARCTELPVFEDRQAASGRQLRLRVAVVPALAHSPAPDPLFILVGGPGQAATDAGAQLAEAFADVRRKRDIVLVDQRGTGASNPLNCPDDEAQFLARRFAPELEVATTRACRQALEADTTQYATPMAMADLDDVRAALGYEQLNLWGGSYGTRAALVYAGKYPKRVRSLILDGLAPVAIQLPLFVPRDAQRALDALYEDCARDADCSRAFPAARGELDALLQSLDASPREVPVKHPRTGQPLDLKITREGLAMTLFNMLYVPELAGLIPLGVHQATEGDYGTIIAAAEAFSGSVKLASGMFLSVVCAEDLPQFSAAQAADRARGTFLGDGWLTRLRAECAEWPAAKLPADYFAATPLDSPSLLLSGQLDPVTPPSWAETVARNLPRSRQISVAGAGHGVSTVGCMPERIAEFLDSLDPQSLDLDCLARLARPGFFTTLAGPSP